MSKLSLREQIKQAFKDAKNPSFKKIAFGSFGWINRLNSLEKDVLALLDGCVIIDKKKLQELADQITQEIDEFYGYHAEASEIVRKKLAELTKQ